MALGKASLASSSSFLASKPWYLELMWKRTSRSAPTFLATRAASRDVEWPRASASSRRREWRVESCISRFTPTRPSTTLSHGVVSPV
ncbi:MAG: hypothetical protein F7B20_07360 [Aeropyrum sp.]|nr:hypothetical protein [Aeropyrum sp.]MCE4616669.1 hypothetical protein [Aeropyrum sp.]